MLLTFSLTLLQILGASDLQDMALLKNQEVLDQQTASREIEHESTTNGTALLSSITITGNTCQEDFFRSDRNDIGEKENATTKNGSVKIKENCEDTTAEEVLRHEPAAGPASGDTEEWNCTIQ